MKLLMGFIVLLVALVAITGCTQTASPSEQTTTETTAPVTTEVTTEATTVATTVVTTIPTTTETIVANVTAPAANVTENVTETATVVPTATAANQVTKIHITNVSAKLGFIPQTDVVLPGTGIIWVNDDNVTHSIKAIGNNTGMFTSGDIIPGATFTYSFSQNTGTYTYAFADNQTITGTIIVKKPCSLSGC